MVTLGLSSQGVLVVSIGIFICMDCTMNEERRTGARSCELGTGYSACGEMVYKSLSTRRYGQFLDSNQHRHHPLAPLSTQTSHIES